MPWTSGDQVLSRNPDGEWDWMILLLVKYGQNWFGLFCLCFSAFNFFILALCSRSSHLYIKVIFLSRMASTWPRLFPKLSLDMFWDGSCWQKPDLCHWLADVFTIQMIVCQDESVPSLVMFIPKHAKGLLSNRNQCEYQFNLWTLCEHPLCHVISPLLGRKGKDTLCLLMKDVWLDQTDPHIHAVFMFPAFRKVLGNPYSLSNGRIFLSHPYWVCQCRPFYPNCAADSKFLP